MIPKGVAELPFLFSFLFHSTLQEMEQIAPVLIKTLPAVSMLKIGI